MLTFVGSNPAAPECFSSGSAISLELGSLFLGLGGKWVTDKTLTHVRWLITVIGDPTSADWLEPLKNPWQDKKLMKCYKKRFKHDL